MTAVPMLSRFISRLKIAPFIILTLLVLVPLADSFGQYIQRSLANNCVGGDNVFIFTVSGCSVTWGVGGGSYTIISQDSNHIRVKWNSPTSTAYVYANYNCPNYPWSGSVYYPQFTIYSSVTPSVSIVASQNNVCLGTNITFTATPTNGGPSPNYVWKVNGNTAQSGGSNQYSSTGLQSGDVVKVEMASNAPCPSPTGATSNSITMNFTQPSPVSVEIYGPTMPMCGSTGASFYASPTNGGATPVYTWYKNGNVVNDNAPGNPSYMYDPQNPLNNGDKIKCVLNSSQTCVSGNPATSNEITVSVTTPIDPAVSINPVPITFCEGSQVTFTANEAASGYTFTNYSWKLNGEPVGTNSSTYVTTGFTQGSVVTVDVTVTGACISSTSASGTTAGAPITVKPLPNAGISPSDSITIFSDETKVINASPTGSGHSYAWKRNGNVLSGETASSHSTNIAGTYTVDVTYDGCMKTSPSLVVSVNVKPVANAGADANITLPATSVVLPGSATDGDGTIASYQWTQQSGPFLAQLSGETTNELTASNLTAGGTYIFRLTATDDIGEEGYDEVSVTVAYPANNYNWIKETVVEVPGQEDDGDINSLVTGEKQVTWTYFDGLGRPSQKVLAQGSSDQYDIVLPMKYDDYGREVYKYLPYVTDGDVGFFKPDALGTTSYTGSPHNLFYTNGTGDKVADDAAPFSKTIYEQSPLNRVTEQGSPGTPWQPDATHNYTSADRTVKFAYEINTAEEMVLKWSYVLPTTGAPLGVVNAGTTGSLAYYPANQLTRNKSKDENHHEVIGYKDIEGRVVLKKVEAPNSQWAETYYIYNDMGDLACVLPPEAVARLNTEYHQSGATEATKNSFLSRWAFRYTYDARHRIILKQVPGVEPVYMVYDNRDRLVMTQDGNQRSGATKYWTFTKYDHLNRPVFTGIHTSSSTLVQMQTAVDNYYANLSGSQAWYESYVGSVTGNAHGYDKASFPQTNITGYLTVTYYDNYEFRSTWIGTYTYVNDGLSQTLNGVVYSQPAAENARVTGQVAGTKVKVLDGGVAGGYTWLKSVSYYDDNQRVIQVLTDTYKGGTDRTSSLYDFAGRVLKNRTTHVERDVTWTAKVGVQEEGNKLIRTAAGTGWGTSGAASVQKLASGTNGWMELEVSETNLPRMIGFSDQNTNTHYNTIDFAWYLNSTGVLSIYESGSPRGTFGAYSSMDVLKIERNGTSIKYYHNNVLKRTVTAASTPALMVDVAFYSPNSTLINVRSSFSTSTRTINRRYVYDHAGRLTHTWHQVDLQPEILLTYNEYNELGQLVDKKLHSMEANASDALQSVDYRYNIRGWMTSINNAELAVNAATNDETGDYFGMDLAYQDALGTSNTAQYNGNISGAKWSVNQGFGTIKAMAYNYAYDAMNRLTAASHKQATTLGTWVTGQFDENGLTYDLNGNIKNLQRKSEGGVTIDNLTYNYGTGATASNKLLYVTDAAAAADKAKGFLDGNTGSDDYTYDANGNMWTDKNKGITANITYNYLNLPELVTRGGNTVRYIYDATGRKLAQQVSFAGSTRRTDYDGEFIYENDVLQFINHEEGRILVSGEKLLLQDGCENAANMTASNATLATDTANGEQYIKVTANGTTVKTGVFPIGGSFPVVPGERYRIRAKGYRTGTSAVYLLIKANTTDLGWPGAALPSSSGTEAWIEQVVTIPAGTSTLQAGVTWNTVTAGEIFYLNEFMIEQLTSVDPEYQYHLRDHLGNVRVTFTSKDETDTYTATLEDNTQATEQATFKNYSRVTNDIYDHTDTGTAYDKAQLLNGGNNSQVGLTKSLAVMPGDTVTAQVYAKYFESTGGSGNLSGFAAALLSAFGLPAPGGGEAGTAAAALQSYGAFIAGGGNTGDPDWPKGWLNMLVFDKDFNLVDLAYQQLDEAYVQPVGNVTKLPMQLLSVSLPIREPGYVYIYISNEGSVQQDIYFDDMTITHQKSKVVQGDDYYPFGLTFNSYQKENSVVNHFLYNGKEQQDELGLGWYDYLARQYDPTIGRFLSVDPLADISRRWSPYAYAYDNPVRFIDPDGMEGEDPNARRESEIVSEHSNEKTGITTIVERTTITTTATSTEYDSETDTHVTTTTTSRETVTSITQINEKGEVIDNSATTMTDKKASFVITDRNGDVVERGGTKGWVNVTPERAISGGAFGVKTEALIVIAQDNYDRNSGPWWTSDAARNLFRALSTPKVTQPAGPTGPESQNDITPGVPYLPDPSGYTREDTMKIRGRYYNGPPLKNRERFKKKD